MSPREKAHNDSPFRWSLTWEHLSALKKSWQRLNGRKTTHDGVFLWPEEIARGLVIAMSRWNYGHFVSTLSSTSFPSSTSTSTMVWSSSMLSTSTMFLPSFVRVTAKKTRMKPLKKLSRLILVLNIEGSIDFRCNKSKHDIGLQNRYDHCFNQQSFISILFCFNSMPIFNTIYFE